jgi:hypothetical protein
MSPQTVERWVTKERNPLPAVRMTAEQTYAMGTTGNLSPSSPTVPQALLRGHWMLLLSLALRGCGTALSLSFTLRRCAVIGATCGKSAMKASCWL